MRHKTSVGERSAHGKTSSVWEVAGEQGFYRGWSVTEASDSAGTWLWLSINQLLRQKTSAVNSVLENYSFYYIAPSSCIGGTFDLGMTVPNLVLKTCVLQKELQESIYLSNRCNLFPYGETYSDFKPKPSHRAGNCVTLTFIMLMAVQSDILECALLKRGNLSQRVCWNVSMSRPPASHIRMRGPGMGCKFCAFFHASEPSH